MPVGRRLTLAAASGTIGVACAVAPWMTWLTATGRAGHCGWTCYRPLAAPLNVVSLSGRGGAHVAPVLAVLLLVLALLLAAVVVVALAGGRPPVVLGRLITAWAFVVLVWTVVVIVRYAEGGTLVRTRDDGTFAANLGAGAIIGLAAAAAALLLGGGVALRARWAGYPAPVADDPGPAGDDAERRPPRPPRPAA